MAGSKKKSNKTRCAHRYNPGFVPKTRTPALARYDNKPLQSWDCDDFAEYIFDNCTPDKKFVGDGTFISEDDVILDYLEEIPRKYSRVYLYGVFELIKGGIRVEK